MIKNDARYGPYIIVLDDTKFQFSQLYVLKHLREVRVGGGYNVQILNV